MKSAAKSADPAALFRAFADVTRLRILSILGGGELCVCDVCEVLGEIQPKISRHLAYLRSAGLIAVRQEGRWAFYRRTPRPSVAEKALLRCVDSCLDEFGVLVRDRKRLESLPRRGRACA